MFGWKKRQDKVTAGAELQDRSVRLDDVAGVLDDLVSARHERIVGEARRIVKDVRRGMDDIVEITGHLESDSLTGEDTDRHIKAIIERGKRQIVSTIRKEAATRLPEVRTYADAVEADRLIRRMLKMIGDVLGRNTRVIHIFAKKYAERLKSTLSAMNAQKDELAGSVRDQESLEASVREVGENVGRLREARRLDAALASKVSNSEAELERARADAESTASEIARIESSEEYAEHKRVLAQIDAVDDERAELDRQVADDFAKVSRSLSKYVYVTSLDKQKKGVLQGLIDDAPATLRGARAEDVDLVLSNTRKSVASGSISVKDVQKSLEQIDAVSATLQRRAAQNAELDEKRSRLARELDAFDHARHESLRSKKGRLSADARLIESRMAELRAEKDSNSGSARSLLQDIQEGLRKATSVRYTVRDEDASAKA